MNIVYIIIQEPTILANLINLSVKIFLKIFVPVMGGRGVFFILFDIF